MPWTPDEDTLLLFDFDDAADGVVLDTSGNGHDGVWHGNDIRADVSPVSLSCDDGDACTEDICDEGAGCVSAVVQVRNGTHCAWFTRDLRFVADFTPS